MCCWWWWWWYQLLAPCPTCGRTFNPDRYPTAPSVAPFWCKPVTCIDTLLACVQTGDSSTQLQAWQQRAPRRRQVYQWRCWCSQPPSGKQLAKLLYFSVSRSSNSGRCCALGAVAVHEQVMAKGGHFKDEGRKNHIHDSHPERARSPEQPRRRSHTARRPSAKRHAHAHGNGHGHGHATTTTGTDLPPSVVASNANCVCACVWVVIPVAHASVHCLSCSCARVRREP